MKAYLINMHASAGTKSKGHLQRSRSNIKVSFLKKWPFRGHSCFTNTSCLFLKIIITSPLCYCGQTESSQHYFPECVLLLLTNYAQTYG